MGSVTNISPGPSPGFQAGGEHNGKDQQASQQGGARIGQTDRPGRAGYGNFAWKIGAIGEQGPRTDRYREQRLAQRHQYALSGQLGKARPKQEVPGPGGIADHIGVNS